MPVFHKAFLKYLTPSARVTQNQHQLKPFSMCHQKVTQQTRLRLPLPGESVQPALIQCLSQAFLNPGRDEVSWQEQPAPSRHPSRDAPALPSTTPLTSENMLPFHSSREEEDKSKPLPPERWKWPTPCSRGLQEQVQPASPAKTQPHTHSTAGLEAATSA